MTMLTPARLREIERLTNERFPIIQDLAHLAETRRLAIVELLADREQLLARLLELEEFIQTDSLDRGDGRAYPDRG